MSDEEIIIRELENERAMLREANEAAVSQEQISRIEANAQRLRADKLVAECDKMKEAIELAWNALTEFGQITDETRVGAAIRACDKILYSES